MRRDYYAVLGVASTAGLREERQAYRRSEEHTSELQSRLHLVCRLLLEKKTNKETIGEADSAQGKYKKHTGGHGHYEDTWLKLEPLNRGDSVQIVAAIARGAIPPKFTPT